MFGFWALDTIATPHFDKELTIFRLATVTTDVNWRKTKDDSVTNYYWNRQVKFLNPANVDYRTQNNKTPIYDD